MIGIEDNEDELLRVLRQIRDASQGASVPGQNSSSTTTREQTTLRVHDTAGSFSPPQNSLNLVNQAWEDDKLSDQSLEDLAPGETQTVARLLSTNTDIYLAVKGVATTEHTADTDGDGKMESAIRYRYEYKTHGGGDSWNTLPGMDTDLPLGEYLGKPVEIIPGKMVGPMSGFRIRFTNETSDTTISADELGAQVAGIIIRTGGD